MKLPISNCRRARFEIASFTYVRWPSPGARFEFNLKPQILKPGRQQWTMRCPAMFHYFLNNDYRSVGGKTSYVITKHTAQLISNRAVPNLFLFYSTRILRSNLLASFSGRKAKFRSKYTDELCLKSQFANQWTWFEAQTVHKMNEWICFQVASIQQSNSFRTYLKFDWMLWFQNYTHRLTREIWYDSINFHSMDCSESACRLHPNFWPEISLRAMSTKLNVQT